MSGLTYESTSRFVTTGDGLDLHYHEAGDGAVLVCLHGGGAGSMAWTQYCRNIDELSRHFRVLMFDLPQFGRSAKPDFTGDEVYPACARVVLAGLDALGVERAHFVGVSQGGGVTAFLAHDHPDRVARAVLVSPGGVWDSILTPTPMDVLRDTFAYYNPGPPDRATLTRILRGMLYDPSELTAEIEERRWKASIDPDVIRVMSDFASQRLGDVRPLLPNIRHEILVLWGIEDRCLPLDTALVYLKGLPNAELLMLQRVGHWIPFERPDDFNRAVIEFFQRARPASDRRLEMAIVCGMAMSHVALTDDAPDDEQFGRIRAHWERCVERFEQARPDVLVAFLDDHFENFRRPMMPALALAVADEHAGPPVQYESWLGVPRRPIPGHARLAKELLTALVDRGFDVCRVEQVELGHNLVEPLRHFGEAAWSVPVIPIFINVFTPPTPSMARAHDLGAAVANAIATWPERVLVLGTGGLSHSPLYWDEKSPDTEFFRRMQRFQDGGLDYLANDPGLFTELGEREIALGKAGVTSINEAWDRELLAALQSGDAAFVRALQVDEMTKIAGAGAREALTWAAVMGAMDASVPDIVGYEPVEPWITGVGFAAYPVVTASAPEAR